MDEFSAHLKSSLRISLLVLSVFFLAWAVLPDYRVYLSGLIVGTIAGIISSQHLAWRIRRFAQDVVDRRRPKSLGFAIRGAIALLAAFLSMKLHYNLAATIVGLFFVQLATLLLGIISKSKK